MRVDGEDLALGGCIVILAIFVLGILWKFIQWAFLT